MENAKHVLPSTTLCTNPYDVAEGADALVLATEWNEFKHLNFDRIKKLMRTPIIMDGRNLWDPDQMRELGFTYFGIGRPVNGSLNH
jgi:UDPglucose 6-dehydrogenase